MNIPLRKSKFRTKSQVWLMRKMKDWSKRTPLRPSNETVNASVWVRGSKGAIGMCCFGGTWTIFVKKSSFFMECLPDRDEKAR